MRFAEMGTRNGRRGRGVEEGWNPGGPVIQAILADSSRCTLYCRIECTTAQERKDRETKADMRDAERGRREE